MIFQLSALLRPVNVLEGKALHQSIIIMYNLSCTYYRTLHLQAACGCVMCGRTSWTNSHMHVQKPMSIESNRVRRQSGFPTFITAQRHYVRTSAMCYRCRDNHTKVKTVVMSAWYHWWHIGPYFGLYLTGRFARGRWTLLECRSQWKLTSPHCREGWEIAWEYQGVCVAFTPQGMGLLWILESQISDPPHTPMVGEVGLCII